MSTVGLPARPTHRFFHGPGTTLGRRSLKWLLWGFALLLAQVSSGILAEEMFGRGQHDGVAWDVFDGLWLLAGLTGGVLAAASGVAAIVAIVRRGERSWAVFAAPVPALLLVLLVIHPLFIND